jgi:hypothetical protein
MISLALALAVVASDNSVADWACADPLIRKNYSRPYEEGRLAARISDECAKPYVVPTDRLTRDVPVALAQDHTLYEAEVLLFTLEIKNRILQLRRRRDIPLAR